MKKRGIFSLVLLLTFSILFAAQDFTDIGTAYELVISDTALAEAETNSSSSVSIITREQIEAYNAQTTAELVNKAIGTNFNSYGGLGSLQTVVIRGASSAKNQIYLDGILISSAHDGTVDLSIIPVSIIDRIEVIKSGAGNLVKTNAIGGMINIITKQGTSTDTPFTLTFENGSFLPLAYGSSNTHNYLSLVDSQRLDFTYANTINGTNLATNLGGIVAQNAYVYTNESTSTTDLRKNAAIYEIHGSINASRNLGENLTLETKNLANYQRLGIPGGYVVDTWGYGGLTLQDYQNNMMLSTKNTFTFTNLARQLATLKAALNYTYNRTFFHDDDYQDSTHNKHKGNFQLEQDWNLGQTYALTTGTDVGLDYVDSTDVGQKTRLTPSLYANGSIYLLEGKISLHPSANLAYLSDIKTLSPNASLGAIYNLNAETALKTTLSYAENPPTFSDLYWPGYGNANLKTEKGLNADLGASYKNKGFTYEGALFGRNIYNAITYDSSTYAPGNIAHSIYVGTEQSVSLEVVKDLSLTASYQYNKSFDLSNGKTLADNVEVSSVRKHTAKASVSYTYTIFNTVLSTEYLGKSTNRDQVFLLNLSVNAKINNYLKAYVAIDNLLNASYALQSGGYPMPGTKIRIGGNWNF